MMTTLRAGVHPSMAYVPVGGTKASQREHEWSRAGSRFDVHLANLGFVRKADEFAFWSTAFGFFSNGHQVWQYGGVSALRPYLLKLPEEDRFIIAHSYGGAVVAYALAAKPTIKIRALITVDCPLRRDLDPIWEQARPAIPLHIHLYSKGWGSRIRVLGQRFRFMREMPWADHNLYIEGGHSGVLRLPKHIPQIDESLALVAHPILPPSEFPRPS